MPVFKDVKEIKMGFSEIKRKAEVFQRWKETGELAEKPSKIREEYGQAYELYQNAKPIVDYILKMIEFSEHQENAIMNLEKGQEKLKEDFTSAYWKVSQVIMSIGKPFSGFIKVGKAILSGKSYKEAIGAGADAMMEAERISQEMDEEKATVFKMIGQLTIQISLAKAYLNVIKKDIVDIVNLTVKGDEEGLKEKMKLFKERINGLKETIHNIQTTINELSMRSEAFSQIKNETNKTLAGMAEEVAGVFAIGIALEYGFRLVRSVSYLRKANKLLKAEKMTEQQITEYGLHKMKAGEALFTESTKVDDALEVERTITKAAEISKRAEAANSYYNATQDMSKAIGYSKEERYSEERDYSYEEDIGGG